MKKLSAVLFVLIVLLPGCGSRKSDSKGLAKGEGDKMIVLASKPMTEQFIIAEMLSALIEQETDIRVEHKEGIGGGTSNIHPAMISGEIDLYPEYTGTGWMFVLEQELISDPEELYRAVKAQYLEKFGIVWSGLYGFNDTFGIAVKRDLAERLGIRSYSDLAEKGRDLIFGAEHDFYERDDGMPGITAVYGFDFKKEVGMDIGLKYQAVASGEVDVINIFSTDGRLREHDMIVLDDDKRFFPSYFCATLVRSEILEKYPELNAVLGMMDGLISNDEMTEMNYRVEIEKKGSREVALAFLKGKGLLKDK